MKPLKPDEKEDILTDLLAAQKKKQVRGAVRGVKGARRLLFGLAIVYLLGCGVLVAFYLRTHNITLGLSTVESGILGALYLLLALLCGKKPYIATLAGTIIFALSVVYDAITTDWHTLSGHVSINILLKLVVIYFLIVATMDCWRYEQVVADEDQN